MGVFVIIFVIFLKIIISFPFIVLFNFSNTFLHGQTITESVCAKIIMFTVSYFIIFKIFRGSLADIDGETKLFRSATDWINELKRTKCRNWRVTKINANFCISKKMPEFFVVPATLHDFYLGEIVNHFSDQFLPAWV